MDTCFKDVTGKQVRIFKIQGRSIRMDSKLIGSNIAWFSRYRIILRTLQMWARDGIGRLNPSLRKKPSLSLMRTDRKPNTVPAAWPSMSVLRPWAT
jgi:hypothetical protein